VSPIATMKIITVQNYLQLKRKNSVSSKLNWEFFQSTSIKYSHNR
jgi:hypothetical protein